MAKKEKAPKEPKEPKKAKKPKKKKGPLVIEAVFANILTVLLVLVGICNLVLAAFIAYTYLKSNITLDIPPAVVETLPEQASPETPFTI